MENDQVPGCTQALKVQKEATPWNQSLDSVRSHPTYDLGDISTRSLSFPHLKMGTRLPHLTPRLRKGSLDPPSTAYINAARTELPFTKRNPEWKDSWNLTPTAHFTDKKTEQAEPEKCPSDAQIKHKEPASAPILSGFFSTVQF